LSTTALLDLRLAFIQVAYAPGARPIVVDQYCWNQIETIDALLRERANAPHG